MRTDGERDQASLRRRLEALRLPVASLQRHGFVMPSDPVATMREPEAVGVGPDGTAFAVWPYREGINRKQVTWHVGGRRRVVGAVDVETDLRVSFVQPLPEGHVLLAAARAKPSAVNAEVWTSSGELRHRGYIGDAIEELLTTSAGKVWAGYFDEAMGGSGPEGHGLARFREDLTAEWLYPLDAELPYISDCYSLNVEGETAYFCPYSGFHILSAAGERVTDWGPPHTGLPTTCCDAAQTSLSSPEEGVLSTTSRRCCGSVETGCVRKAGDAAWCYPTAWRPADCVTPAEAMCCMPSADRPGTPSIWTG